MTDLLDVVLPCRNSAAELAANDQPLKALAVTTDPVERAALERRVAHLTSPTEYAAFYNEPAPERPWMALEQVPVCHQTMPRWGVIWQQLMLQQHQDVLELGCMDGFCSLNLALHGVTAHGVDVNVAAVEEARERARHFKVPALATFESGMIEDVALGPRFDAVLVMEVLEHVRDVDAVLAVATAHLRDGGRVYVSAPLTAPKHQHEREAREHVRLLDYPAMMALLTAPGRRLVFYTQLRTPDGWHHCGAFDVAA